LTAVILRLFASLNSSGMATFLRYLQSLGSGLAIKFEDLKT
jgi:hypothetical protein